ncbi:MAG: hypothetical protein KGI97_08050 [Alphaproteobacteria bacterium]|nr:hypothetical protein [Alphaproteobacteria bacterium]
MNEKVTYWGSMAFGAIALILVVVNISLATSNQKLQTELAARQEQINEGQRLSLFNQNLVRVMAEDAIKGNNAPIRDLLAAQGITIKEHKAEEPKAENSKHKK